MLTFLSLKKSSIFGRVELLSALVALAVDGLVDGDHHGALLAGQPHAVRVEAVGQRYLPPTVRGLATTSAVLEERNSKLTLYVWKGSGFVNTLRM